MSGLTHNSAGPAKGSNAKVALICVGVFVLMVAAAFAAVPFYRAFCQATGFNGAVRRARAADATRAADPVSAQTVSVRFDTNVNGVDWRFEPEQARQTVHLGENNLAFFRATNLGHTTVTGRALFNVLSPNWNASASATRPWRPARRRSSRLSTPSIPATPATATPGARARSRSPTPSFPPSSAQARASEARGAPPALRPLADGRPRGYRTSAFSSGPGAPGRPAPAGIHERLRIAKWPMKASSTTIIW
jgi:hypothetical protein